MRGRNENQITQKNERIGKNDPAVQVPNLIILVPMENGAPIFSFWQKLAAWATHAFTASGVVCAFFAIVYTAEHEFATAFYFLAAALVIDGVDGTFARLFKVKEVLPHISGKTIDYVIDFANYAIIPGYFLYECGWDTASGYQYLLPEQYRWIAIAVLLLVSALYYGKDGMVDENLHFVGFPVMWNAVAFYLYFVFAASPWVSFGLIILFAILHFIPLKYPYPSRTRKFMWLNVSVTLLTIAACIWLLAIFDFMAVPMWLKVACAVGGGYYFLMTFWYTWDEARGISKED